MESISEYESYTIDSRSVQDRFYSIVRGKSPVQIDLILTHVENSLHSEKPFTHIPLSPRESEVLALIANGYTRKDVGKALDITVNTAAKHIANIYQKLHITTVAEATKYAIRNGLIAG